MEKIKTTRNPERVQTRFLPIKIPMLRITKKFRSKPSSFALFLQRFKTKKQQPLDLSTLFVALKGTYSTKKLLGSGIFGSTYVFHHAKHRLLDILARSARGYVVRGYPLKPDESIAMKIIKHSSTRDVFAEFDREVQTLTYLQKREPVIIGKTTYTASQHVPKLHLACHFQGFSVIVQSYAPGKRLAAYSNVMPRTIARFERAILSLWLAGVAHTDLHSENIMYDDKAKKITIIDFGRAVILSPDAIQTLRKNLLAFASDKARHSLLLKQDVLKLISKNVIVHTTDVTHLQTGIKRYLDDETMIQYHIARRCLKPTCTPEALAKERLTTWVPSV